MTKVKKHILSFLALIITITAIFILLDPIGNYFVSKSLDNKYYDPNAKKVKVYHNICVWVPDKCSINDKMTISCKDNKIELNLKRTNRDRDILISYKKLKIKYGGFTTFGKNKDQILLDTGSKFIIIDFHTNSKYTLDDIFDICEEERLML